MSGGYSFDGKIGPEEWTIMTTLAFVLLLLLARPQPRGESTRTIYIRLDRDIQKRAHIRPFNVVYLAQDQRYLRLARCELGSNPVGCSGGTFSGPLQRGDRVWD